MPVRYYKYDKPFVLENGERLSELQIAYHTYGKFKGNNAIWVCHARPTRTWPTGGRGPSSRDAFSTRAATMSCARTSSGHTTVRRGR